MRSDSAVCQARALRSPRVPGREAHLGPRAVWAGVARWPAGHPGADVRAQRGVYCQGATGPHLPPRPKLRGSTHPSLRSARLSGRPAQWGALAPSPPLIRKLGAGQGHDMIDTRGRRGQTAPLPDRCRGSGLFCVRKNVNSWHRNGGACRLASETDELGSRPQHPSEYCNKASQNTLLGSPVHTEHRLHHTVISWLQQS